MKYRRVLCRSFLFIIVVLAGIFIWKYKKVSEPMKKDSHTEVSKCTSKDAIEKPKNSQTKKAVSEALKIYKEKPAYSQSKRMQKGYVDCSSYVWRCYKKAGIVFGEESYAPTAAEIARWCEKHNALMSSNYVKKGKEKLQPGDLIFYTKRKGKNGRFKNIAHTAIYIGNGKMLHADGASPAYGNPWYREVAAVARPAK